MIAAMDDRTTMNVLDALDTIEAYGLDADYLGNLVDAHADAKTDERRAAVCAALARRARNWKARKLTHELIAAIDCITRAHGFTV